MTRVLVVDDDRAIRQTLSMVLEDAGYDVAMAPDGVVALQHMREAHDQLIVLLDLMMPRLDGAGVVSAMLSDARLARHKVILITASSQSVDRLLAATLACLHAPVLRKPFDVDVLLAELEEQIALIAS